MNIEFSTGPMSQVLCDSLFLGLCEDGVLTEAIERLSGKEIAGYIEEVAGGQPECTQYGKILTIPVSRFMPAKNIVLIGLGKKTELSFDKIRQLSAIAVRAAQETGAKTIATMLYGIEQLADKAGLAQAIVEGAIMGNYKFVAYKSEKKTSPVKKLIIIEDKIDKKFEQKVLNGKVIAESVNFCRDLVNHPSNYMTPSRMALQAAEIGRQTGMEVTILDRKEMEDQGMNALLAVAKGSNEPPKMIVLNYMGDKSGSDYIAFIGKGITFDSGGISLKPSEKMGDMKGDMAGGAAVLAAMRAIGKIKPKVNVIGIVPCTENMPSGHALKPGDVITAMSGKTIEIITTDAEGRLVLADAITYAIKSGATRLIDLATLTGACVVALGNIASGVITNEPEWLKEVLAAAEQAGEKMWELPHYEEYAEQIKSDIADIKNSGGRMAGAITAGMFLAQFARSSAWVHIDIAGTSDSDKTKGYNIKGGTGAGVRSLVQLALHIGGQ